MSAGSSSALEGRSPRTRRASIKVFSSAQVSAGRVADKRLLGVQPLWCNAHFSTWAATEGRKFSSVHRFPGLAQGRGRLRSLPSISLQNMMSA